MTTEVVCVKICNSRMGRGVGGWRRALAEENARLTRVVADLVVQNTI